MSDPALSSRAQTRERLEIRLLGAFAVSLGGEGLPDGAWASLRAAQLVQLLSLAEGHRLPREQVIDSLWPELDAEAGGANLRKAAHHARQALGIADAIVLQAGQALLCPSRLIAVDAVRFEALANDALARRDAAACAEAAALYGGDLLPGAPYEPWTDSARTRLRLRYLELLRASGQWERLAEAEPTDEPAHRALMRRDLEAGNRPAAIRWYSRLRGALRQTLGVAPDRETHALYDECVAGLRLSGPAFVGRQMELAQAAAWLGAPQQERAAGLLVRGLAGIGKSAFCRQLGAMARERGWTVVSIDALQPGHAYAVIAAALEQLIAADRTLLERVGDGARGVLAMLTPLAAPAPALHGPLGRHQVIGAFRRALVAAAKGGVAMVQVDDAHLMGAADAEALLELIVTGRPVHVVLVSRPPASDSTLGHGVVRLLGSRQLVPIDLGPLDDEDARSLVREAAPRPLAAQSVERIVRLAQGNAFAALELARCAAPECAARLPASVSEAITARLCGDVDERVIPLLRVLALSGDELDTAMVLALSASDEAETLPLLDAALAAGVLFVEASRYRFRHDLVRQALVDAIAPHQRLKVHREAARRLAALNAPAALIARHWLAGGSPVEATPWLLAAAREALQLGAFADALRHVEPVLAFKNDHAEALRLRADALDALGDPAALAAYRAAAEVAGEPESHNLRAKCALAQVKLGDPKGALRVLEGLKPTSVDGRLAEALAYSGAAALGVADPTMGTARAAEARRLALESGDTAAIVVASWAQAAAAHARGELHRSVWADLHETRHVPHLAARVFDGQLCITQRFLYGARPYPQVIAFAEAIAAEARRLGAARGYAFGVTLRGEAELLAGDLDAAEEHLRLGARLHRDIAGATGEAFSLQRLAELELYRGQRDAAQTLLDEALDVARQTDIGFHLLDRIYGTRIALAGHDPAAALHVLEDAREAVRGPLETCPGCRITFAVPAAIAAARARRLDLAEHYEQASEYLANVVMRLPAWYAALEEVRAHLAQARGDDAAAAAGFLAAARKFAGAGQPCDAARCQSLAAENGAGG
jgi:DNA-binding SARP family transcriptional activator/tetratricopeptide (TPR) repeat protein